MSGIQRNLKRQVSNLIGTEFEKLKKDTPSRLLGANTASNCIAASKAFQAINKELTRKQS